MKYELPPARLRALPVQVIEHGEDVILKRGRAEVRVSGAGACSAVGRLLALLGGEGRTRQELVEQFLPPDRPAIDALVDHLLSRRIVADAGSFPGAEGPEGRLDVFYWHFGTSAARVQASLANKRFMIVGVNRIARQLATTLGAEAGGSVELLDAPVLRDRSLFDDGDRIRDDRWPAGLLPVLTGVTDPARVDPDRFDCLVATCDHGGQTCFREWNQYCVLHGRNFLPVFLEDLVGYVGPLVVPHETACFECLRLRRDSHLADPAAYRASEALEGRDGVAAGFHPSMAIMLAEAAVLELVRFYGIGSPWWRVGTVLELNALAPSLNARKVLRLPRCPVCSVLGERSPNP